MILSFKTKKIEIIRDFIETNKFIITIKL